ncbi:hypothetical protein F0225_05165 [Vibrio pectenicida]|uniref:PEP-utilising enzyme mobile domain-containing protein n=1 Tax=Vibrio pectenicida TaxID=62763 RepID=A0A7Y3ZX52_9VIBR|nr:PEP-utilizing enzyme [Vibrio pectenicida]NOH70736.1 hypothetical protein [Vibrio pectenicida]
MNLKLSSKAKTLADLAEVITSAKVLPLVRFYANEYYYKKRDILSECISHFGGNVVVRSSSINEDNEETSNAGGFESVIDVPLNEKDIDRAIEKVIDSYSESLNEGDEVLIQPMLKNVSKCGVIFTADLDTLSPYYIINYDESGSTIGVTGGTGYNLKTVISFKNNHETKQTFITKAIQTSKECEVIFQNEHLDIEFAYVNEEIYILQVRAIVRNNKNDLSKIYLDDSLNKLNKKIKKLNAPHPKLLGSRTIFGVMPDWNPAEIIGIKPKRLAVSLYKEIVTNEIWAYQRDNYGYRNLRSFPLLVSFLGVPYIDVRVSFNSFVPKKLHSSIASKLVEYYLDELVNNSSYHDKVEFEIVFSCYYFGIDKKLKKLAKSNFSDNELKRIEYELLELTNEVINTGSGLYKKDLSKLSFLEEKFNSIVDSDLAIIDKIYWLIEDCKRYGTLPFAGVARAAFIAVQILNSFVSEKILTESEKNRFLNSIETISKELNKDRKLLNKYQFLEKYGHLRPGTYDICSPRYDEAYDEYFSGFTHEVGSESFEFSQGQKDRIEKLIVESGLKCNFDELIQFIRESIEGREYAKFSFTKHLSQILNYIQDFGAELGFSKEDLAYLNIMELKSLYSTLDHRDVYNIFKEDIDKNKNCYQLTQAVKLPSIIYNASDIYQFSLQEEEPNFVTLKSITAEVVDLEFQEQADLDGKIVCIQSADPGYDYLFAKNIAGLITCYGGANSHMAIRCAETGIPAVIGCGESMFNKYKCVDKLFINAENKQIKIIS